VAALVLVDKLDAQGLVVLCVFGGHKDCEEVGGDDRATREE
jgi:hypothetical protein